MSRSRKPTQAQREALAALEGIARAGGSPLIEVTDLGVKEHHAGIRIRFRTVDIEHVPEGLQLEPEEDVLFLIPPSFPWHVPETLVDHERFVGFAHVLQGSRLCIYMNPAQEWHPNKGIVGFLNDVWKWFEDAATGRFDASQALFHPVGGVVHRTPGTPLVVVRYAHDFGAHTFLHAQLKFRSADRLDLLAGDPEDGASPILLVTLSGPLQYGAGTTIGSLLKRIARLGHPKVRDFAALLAQSAARGAEGTPTYFLLALPFPSKSGHMEYHLVAGRLPSNVSDQLRRAAAKAGALTEATDRELPSDTQIEWCRVSDERESITTRRDVTRPVNSLLRTDVELWGCGGLGAWMGEFVARAGAKRITLCDPFLVTGGLLVRQDYVEDDIGRSKADALAERLRAIRDDLVVVTRPEGIVSAVSDGNLPDCDLLIDATVNTSVSALVSGIWDDTKNRPVVASVAIDAASGTLGIATVATPGGQPSVAQVDDYAGGRVAGDPDLERFLSLWEEPTTSDEIVPTRGCSVPTFHGSAADLAAIAGVLLNLVSPHIRSDSPGAHLAALPHAPGQGPAHFWIPYKG